MTRPNLSVSLSKAEFLENYWLKEELVAFCRAEKLATSGSKEEVTERIAHFLETGERLGARKVFRKKGAMPAVFSRETVIGEGWRCTQELRAFFEQETVLKFHFNGFMRDFIGESGVGQTLGDAIERWEASKRAPKGEIGKQFEYNQHMRDYFEANPDATREEAMQAWRERRGIF